MTLSWQEEVRRRLRERRERALVDYDEINRVVTEVGQSSWYWAPQGEPLLELQKELERERAISDFWRAEAARLRDGYGREGFIKPIEKWHADRRTQ